ncbi:hypothetical protein Tco_1192776 [Tanacetum coccineum]
MPLFKMGGLQCNKFRGDKGKVILVLVNRVMLLVLGETMQVDRQGLLNDKTVQGEGRRLGNVTHQSGPRNNQVLDDQSCLVNHSNTAAFSGLRIMNTYDSDCDDISNAKAVLMANISNYGSDVISEVPYSETYLNDMENQSVHAMQDFKQSPLRTIRRYGKRFTPQQELSAKLAFWLRMSNPSSKSSDASPVKIEAPKELPKVSLVNESLKKLKFHLARFDNVVKKRTTHDARTEGKWGLNN